MSSRMPELKHRPRMDSSQLEFSGKLSSASVYFPTMLYNNLSFWGPDTKKAKKLGKQNQH